MSEENRVQKRSPRDLFAPGKLYARRVRTFGHSSLSQSSRRRSRTICRQFRFAKSREVQIAQVPEVRFPCSAISQSADSHSDMSKDPALTFSGLVKRLIVDLRSRSLFRRISGIQRRTVLKIRDGATSAKLYEQQCPRTMGRFSGDLPEAMQCRCRAVGEFIFPFEVLGDPTHGKPVDEKKKKAFIQLAKRQFVENAAPAGPAGFRWRFDRSRAFLTEPPLKTRSDDAGQKKNGTESDPSISPEGPDASAAEPLHRSARAWLPLRPDAECGQSSARPRIAAATTQCGRSIASALRTTPPLLPVCLRPRPEKSNPLHAAASECTHGPGQRSPDGARRSGSQAWVNWSLRGAGGAEVIHSCWWPTTRFPRRPAPRRRKKRSRASCGATGLIQLPDTAVPLCQR